MDAPRREPFDLWIARTIGSRASLVVHTILFLSSFSLYFFGIAFEDILIGLTTILSLEAIYLALFIQMTVNRTTESLQEVQEDVGEIQEDVHGLEENVEDISEDVEDISEEVEDISEDIDKLQEEVKEDDQIDAAHGASLDQIKEQLKKLLDDVESLRK